MNKEVRQALYAKITGAEAVTKLLASSKAVHHGVAPAQAPFPYVIVNQQAGRPEYVFGDTAWDQQVWLVKAVDRGSTSNTAEDIAAALNELLTEGSLSITGGTLFDLRRESDVDYIEADGDQLYRHHGALYRLTAK